MKTLKKTMSTGMKTIKKILKFAGIIALLFVAFPAFKERTFLAKFSEFGFSMRVPDEKIITESFPKEKIDADTLNAMKAAYAKTEKYASDKLDKWIEDVMEKADTDFLEWYFNFWNMKTRDLKSMGFDIMHFFNNSLPTSQEKLLEELEHALNSRLFQSETAQLIFQNILRESAQVYNDSLSASLSQIQKKYNVTKPRWEEYLSNLSHVVCDSGTSMTPLHIKGIAAGSVAITFATGSFGVKCVKTIGNTLKKVFTKTTTKTIAKTAATTGSKSLGKFAGPIITVAIVAWDILDYKMTEKKDRPVLRQNILEYLCNVKSTLLYDEEFGICTELNNIQNNLAKSIAK